MVSMHAHVIHKDTLENFVKLSNVILDVLMATVIKMEQVTTTASVTPITKELAAVTLVSIF